MGVGGGLIGISRLHYPVTALGPGRRIGIWVQGCSIGCAGCISRDTWDPAAGTATTVDAVLEQCRSWGGGELDGITVSGGEPFDQPEALGRLLDGLADWRAEESRELDVLCYSGYPEGRLRRRHAALLDRIDALIAGPFNRRAGPGGLWRGSANQRIVPLTPLGERRYAAADAPGPRPLQVVVSDDAAWLIGVPRIGDMDRLESELRQGGIEFEEASWR